MASGGLRYWKDGRDAEDVLLGLFEYPKTAAHPDFTLSLRVNFAAGAGGEDAFRFFGPEGVMSLGRDGITITRRDPDKEPGYTIDTFAKADPGRLPGRIPQEVPGDGRASCAPAARRSSSRRRTTTRRRPTPRTSWSAVRTRTPVIEDAVFGLRAAGPALLCNVSQREKRVRSPGTRRRCGRSRRRSLTSRPRGVAVEVLSQGGHSHVTTVGVRTAATSALIGCEPPLKPPSHGAALRAPPCSTYPSRPTRSARSTCSAR